MHELFDRVIAELQVLDGFRDYGRDEWSHLPNGCAGVRRPIYEGDFATTTDASLLFEEGLYVPQEAVNLTRISVSKALQKAMPDWAVREWLRNFLQRRDLPELAPEIAEALSESLNFIPVPGRFPKRFFDFRVGPSTNRDAIFRRTEAVRASEILSTHQPHIVAGVLLWQFALMTYACSLSEYVVGDRALDQTRRSRFVSFCRFLHLSAFRLASFGALWPMAIASRARLKMGGEIALAKLRDVAPAIEEFAARGGFVRHSVPNRIRRIANQVVALFNRFRGSRAHLGRTALGWNDSSPSKPVVIVCAAKEALTRWASMPLSDRDASCPGSLAEYIAVAEALIERTEPWAHFVTQITSAIQSNSKRAAMRHSKGHSQHGHLSTADTHGCPYYRR